MKATLVLGILTLALAGCGSSTQVEPAASPVSSAVATPAVTTSDPCEVLTADDLNAVLGTEFEPGDAAEDEARQITNCTYTITENVAGTDLPISIVDVGLAGTPGAEAYTTNIDLAPAYFGADPEPVDVPGANKAYVVMNAETNSPVLGMLVGDRFALIQIGVEGATTEQAQQLATTAAARIG